MAKVQVNLRVEESLKNKVQEIAKEKDTSLNDIVVRALEEFIGQYEIQKVADEAIPSRKQLLSFLEERYEKIKEEYKNTVKSALFTMIENADSQAFIPLSKIYPNGHINIIESVVSELLELGYFVHIFAEFNGQTDNLGNHSPIDFNPGDIGISLDKAGEKYYKTIEDKFKLPF